jgi:Ca2+-binding RTX toxin-like protein
MAVTATFLPGAGLLSTIGDNLNNTITYSRNAAGNILVNGGAVSVKGGTPTVANTSQLQAFGLGGDDNVALDEANGALPAAQLFGGAGNDTLTGGSGADQLFGQQGNDTLLGKGGNASRTNAPFWRSSPPPPQSVKNVSKRSAVRRRRQRCADGR